MINNSSARGLMRRVTVMGDCGSKRFQSKGFTTIFLRDGVFREKSALTAWTMDKGAYPVMSVIVLGLLGGSMFGLHYMKTSPDIKLVPGKSRSKMFRGELADEYQKDEVDTCKPWE